MKGMFTLDPPPTPLEFPLYTVEGACHSPTPPREFLSCTVGGPNPWNWANFQLGWVPFGKYICVKNIVALYYCQQKIICMR